jgi:photosystem II stability/assembly factor-like uncharacterized protein
MHVWCIVLYLGTALLHSASPIGTGQPSARFERIGPFGGDVRSLLLDSQHPDVAYLGTSNGRIFKSVDGGSSWTVLSPGIGSHEYVMDTLVQHPAEPEHIYAGAWDLHSDGGGLFESRDAGLKWSRILLPEASPAVRGFAICRSNPARMIVGTLGGVFVSANGGRAWKQVGGSKLHRTESVAIDPVDPRILYVGTWRLGYKSLDFGNTWTLVSRGMPLDSDVFSISIHEKNPQVVYSSACSGVYKSVNRAQTWTRLKILRDRFTIRAQVVYLDPADSRRVYTGTTEGLFVSQNEGRTWARLTPSHVTVNAIQVDPRNNRRILIGTEYQGLQMSEDGGTTWRESNRGFVHKRISWIVPDTPASGRLLAGVDSGRGGLYHYDNRDQTWRISQIGPGVRILSYLILPGDHGHLAGTSQGLYWLPVRSDRWKKLAGSIAKRTVYSLELDPASPVVYAGTDQGIYRTSLAAMDFRLPPGYRLSPSAWCIYAPEADPGLVYAGTSLGLLRSWDKGTTWNVISAYGLPARATIDSIAVSPSSKERLLAGTSAGLFESTNGGIHWRKAGDGRLGVAISSVIFPDKSGDFILAADKTFGGLFYSQDAGLAWEKIYDPSHPSPVSCLAMNPETPSVLYLGTRFDGIYRFRLR